MGPEVNIAAKERCGPPASGQDRLQTTSRVVGHPFSGMNAESAPTTVRIFMNKPNLAFAEAEDEPCTQDFDLTDGGVDFAGNTSKPLELKFVKFQNVQSLQIFISDN